MQVDLIALDIDGTLLTDQYKLTERTKQAIQKAEEFGAKIVLATGRNPTSSFPIAQELGIKNPLITHNGAVLVHPLTKRSSFELGFHVQDMCHVIDYCRQEQLHFNLNGSFNIYVEDMSPLAQKMYVQFFAEPVQVDDIFTLSELLVKLTIFAGKEKLDKVFSDLLKLCPQWRMIRSGENFIDIIHPQATKGFALQHLLDTYQFKPQNTIAIGNYFNDLEMIQLAGLGVAMENSPEEVKELADRVTKSNNDDGVALILEEIFNID